MPHFFLHVYISPHISRGRNLAVGESLHPDDTHAHASLHKFFTTQGLAQGCRLLVGVHLHRWYTREKDSAVRGTALRLPNFTSPFCFFLAPRWSLPHRRSYFFVRIYIYNIV